MNDIINLRLHRKRKMREEKALAASENAARFGRSKTRIAQEEDEKARLSRLLDGHRRETPETPG